jgi:type IV pilus assembly protein PilC
MPLYTYKAKDSHGKVIEDVIQAGNRQEAATNLKAEGLQVLIVKSPETKLESLFSGKISVADKATFCRFLATMLRAGMPLPEALNIIRKESENKRLQKVLADVTFQIRKGSSLSVIMSKYPNDFDEIFLTMVKAGEESGNLDKTFDYLSKQLLASHEMTQKVKGAMVYPAVILVAMAANGILMITFVLPKISEVFSQLNLKLPLTTRLILGLGNFVGSNTVLVLGGAALIFIFLFLLFYLRKSRKILSQMFMKLPLVKKLVDQIDVARFARTLSALLKSAVPILPALDVSSDVLSQDRLKREAKKFSAEVAAGESLSDVLVRSKKVFPQVMVQTIRAGEESGSLEIVLEELAEFYEKEVDYSLKRLTSIIEPVLMLVIGVGVGAMVVMMVIPIYSIVGSLEGGF